MTERENGICYIRYLGVVFERALAVAVRESEEGLYKPNIG